MALGIGIHRRRTSDPIAPPGFTLLTETVNGVTFYLTEVVDGATYYLMEAI